jgi:hypothetical protein
MTELTFTSYDGELLYTGEMIEEGMHLLHQSSEIEEIEDEFSDGFQIITVN